jgi:hypothetical protein
MPTNSGRGLLVSTIVIFGIANVVAAQQSQPPAKSAVRPAAFNVPTPSAAGPQTVTFGRQDAHVGDEVEQKLSLAMKLATTVRQGNQLVEKSQTTVRTDQRRTVTTTAVEAGRTMAVKVRFAEATKTISIGEPEPSGSAEASNIPSQQEGTTPQPVQGKTYLCRREPGDEGRLIVTDEAGATPTKEELEIVSQSMEMVGRANPLAEFLHGRIIAVGETVELPKAVADRVFNLSEKFGKVSRFDLTLQKLTADNTGAVFSAQVDAGSNDASQMRLQVAGPIVVDIASCRAAQTSLAGPIGMSETRGSYSATYQVLGTGRLQMSIASDYRDLRR